MEHLGVDDAGVEGDGGEATWELLSKGLSESFDGPFGGAVGGDVGGGRASPSGGEVDDDAFVFGEHGWEGVTNHVGGAVDVDSGELVEFIAWDFPEGGGRVDDGGVVDEEVGGASGEEGGVAEFDGGDFVGDVEGEEVGVVRKFFGESLEGDFVSGAGDEGVSSVEEFGDEGAAEARGATGEPNSHKCPILAVGLKMAMVACVVDWGFAR